MRQFPVILIPPEVQRISQSKPAVPKFELKLPRVPSYRQPHPINIQEALFQTIGLMFVVAIVTSFFRELGIILLIVGMVAIFIRIRYQFVTYKRREKKHQEKLARYFLKLEAYCHEEITYQHELAIALSKSRLVEFRHQQYQKFFAKLTPNEKAIAIGDIHNPFDGVQATDTQIIEGVIYYFGVTLQQYLSGTVYQGINIHIPSIGYNWIPSLVYIDNKLNFHIAIEISLTSENAAIMMRNDLAERFLVDSGWIIIRFSQDQILQTPTECCKEFAKLLDRLSLDVTVLSSFADIADLIPVKY